MIETDVISGLKYFIMLPNFEEHFRMSAIHIICWTYADKSAVDVRVTYKTLNRPWFHFRTCNIISRGRSTRLIGIKRITSLLNVHVIFHTRNCACFTSSKVYKRYFLIFYFDRTCLCIKTIDGIRYGLGMMSSVSKWDFIMSIYLFYGYKR